MLKNKQRGKVKTSSVRAIWTSCYHREGMCHCSLSLLEPFSFQISGQDFFLEGRAMTPLVSLYQLQGIYSTLNL
jgi:hypothetical protein